MNPDTDEEDERPADDNAPFSALAFKIMTDPYVGRLSFFRVYSGKLTTGSSVLNSTKNQKERIGRILQMHANHREDIEEVFSGDIAAAVGLKNTTTGDTLCDDNHPIIWSPWSSLTLSSAWQSSPRPRLVRRRWAWRW